MISYPEMLSILENVRCGDFSFSIADGKPHCAPYLQVTHPELDVYSGEVSTQRGRKWQLSRFMTPSELVQTAFMAVLAYVEHETRELFTYKGERIFGPHFDVEALVDLSKRKALDYRKEPV